MADYFLLSHKNPNGQWYYTTRNAEIRGIVAHTPETLEDYTGPDGAAEAVARFLSGTARPASIHVCIDSDSIVDCLPDSYTAFHAAGVNSSTVGAEIGYKASSWRNMPEQRLAGVVDNFATWAAPRVVEHRLDLRVIESKAEWDGGARGFLTHKITEDWRLGAGQTRRSDPGRDFPWNRVFEAIETKLSRTETTPMFTPIEQSQAAQRASDVACVAALMNHAFGLSLPNDGTWGNDMSAAVRAHLNPDRGTYLTGNDYAELLMAVAARFSGVPGPAGPRGPDGIRGPAGPKGDPAPTPKSYTLNY